MRDTGLALQLSASCFELPGRGSALAAYIHVRLTSLSVGGLNPSSPAWPFNCLLLVSINYMSFENYSMRDTGLEPITFSSGG